MPVSPYIKRLREVVGTALIQVPAVSTVVRDDHGRVLLVFETGIDRWSTPGGSIEVDEVPEDAARREVLEETGLNVQIDGIVTVLGGPELRVQYKNGDQVAYVTTVYRGSVISGAVEPDGVEVSAARWFATSELSSLPLGTFATLLFRYLDWI